MPVYSTNQRLSRRRRLSTQSEIRITKEKLVQISISRQKSKLCLNRDGDDVEITCTVHASPSAEVRKKRNK